MNLVNFEVQKHVKFSPIWYFKGHYEIGPLTLTLSILPHICILTAEYFVSLFYSRGKFVFSWNGFFGIFWPPVIMGLKEN